MRGRNAGEDVMRDERSDVNMALRVTSAFATKDAATAHSTSLQDQAGGGTEPALSSSTQKPLEKDEVRSDQSGTGQAQGGEDQGEEGVSYWVPAEAVSIRS